MDVTSYRANFCAKGTHCLGPVQESFPPWRFFIDDYVMLRIEITAVYLCYIFDSVRAESSSLEELGNTRVDPKMYTCSFCDSVKEKAGHGL